MTTTATRNNFFTYGLSSQDLERLEATVAESRGHTTPVLCGIWSPTVHVVVVGLAIGGELTYWHACPCASEAEGKEKVQSLFETMRSSLAGELAQSVIERAKLN